MTTPPPAPSAPPDTDAQWCDLEALVTIHAEHYAAGRQADGETVGGEILDAFRSFRTEVALLTHKIITCGVAASHPDAGLSRRGAYAGAWDSPQAEEVRALRAERDALRRSRQGDPMTTPSLAAIEEWIRNLAEDGTSDSDAAGSLRAAWEALTAERDAARAEVEAVQKDWHQRRDAATAAYLATYDRLQSERDAALSRADEAERARAEGAERDLAQARAEHVNDVACGERRLIRCEEDRDAARARAERLGDRTRDAPNAHRQRHRVSGDAARRERGDRIARPLRPVARAVRLDRDRSARCGRRIGAAEHAAGGREVAGLRRKAHRARRVTS